MHRRCQCVRPGRCLSAGRFAHEQRAYYKFSSITNFTCGVARTQDGHVTQNPELNTCPNTNGTRGHMQPVLVQTRGYRPNLRQPGDTRPINGSAAEISISDFFPASAISEISRFFFADTRNLWCTGLYWSTATAAGATYTVLDCTRRSAVLMRARARHFPTVAEWGFCPP